MSDPVVAAPFLKWVGGKTRSLGAIEARMPSSWNRYFEPFFGGGAVFWRCGSGPGDVLGDINGELIATLEALRDDVEGIIIHLGAYHYTPECFYEVRALDRDPGLEVLSPTQIAARMIYLNRTCFNGVYRVNKAGQFNVPIGRYKNPTICNEPLLRACSEKLQGVELQVAHFAEVIDLAGDGDVLYVDPPYVPVSQSANFVGYSPDGFGTADHVDLLAALRRAAQRGARFLLSSSDAYGLQGRYEAEGWAVDRLEVGRSLNSNTKKREPVIELLAYNPGD